MAEDGDKVYHPSEEPTVTKFLLSSLYNTMFYSEVVLLFCQKKKKKLAHRKGQLWEEREWGIHSHKCLYPPV